MNIVIDIPEEEYKWIKKSDKTVFADVTSKECMLYAIKNGIPLPKGYGRLGDLDALRKEVSSWGMNDYEPSDFIDEIDRADTIIEADTPKIRKGTPLEENDSGYNCENWIP